MTELVSLQIARWEQACPPSEQARAHATLESGGIVLFPDLGFELDGDEIRLLTPAVAGRGKNVSFDPARDSLRAGEVGGTELELMKSMLRRFARCSDTLLHNLLPGYRSSMTQARTSFRPVEIEGRRLSWRKDDSRLHVDSFPSSPTQGKRILRLFCNINPQGRSRVWRLGEPFESVAQRFVPAMSEATAGSARLLALLGATKTRRSAYDHFMLQLHDLMKADTCYQAEARQRRQAFAPGSTWCAFTDQVAHAAMAGQHALEQTFHLPVDRMREPFRAPLRVLERILGRALT